MKYVHLDASMNVIVDLFLINHWFSFVDEFNSKITMDQKILKLC